MLRRSLPLILSTLAFAISSYATNVWLGRHLGPAEFGVLGVLTSLISALNVMQVSGIPQAMSKFIAEDAQHGEDILASGLKLQLALSATLMALFAAVSPILAAVFHERSLVKYVLIAVCVLPGYAMFTVYGGFYNGLHRFGRQARINAAYAVAKLVLVIGLAIRFGILGAILGYALSPIVAVAVGFRVPHRERKFDVRKLVNLSVPLVGFSGLALLQYSVDLFTVKAVLHDKASAGYYTAAQSISIIPFLGLAAVGQVLLPSVSRLLAAGRRQDASATVAAASRLLLMLLLPTTALIVGSAPGVVKLLFGSAYAPAVPALRMLVVGYIAVSAFGMFASVLNGAGRAKVAMGIAAIGFLATLVLCVLLVRPFGLVGAASATGIGGVLAACGAVLATRRFLPFTVRVGSVVRIGGASVLVLLLAAVPVAPIALVLWWPAVGVVYVVLLVVTGEITADERGQIWRLLPDRLRPRSVR